MHKNKLRFCFLLVIFGFFLIPSAQAAEVYYLGSDSPSSSAKEPNPSYSIIKRINDLFSSLGSVQKDKEASGSLGGTLTQSVTWNDVGGNTSKSYLERGVDYVTELNLNMREKLPKDYHFEGQWFLRKTDDRRVESRRDVRLKQIDMRVLNDQYLYQLGDFYADFSQFVLGSSLEGFNVDMKPSKKQHYQIVAARKNGPDLAADLFQRNVFGVKADHYFFQDSDAFANFRVGIQAATTQDDSATLLSSNNAKDLRNTVVGFDGEMALPKIFSLQYEYARSAYLEDEDSAVVKDMNFGSAFRLQPLMHFGKTNLRYLYYYGQPKFYSDAGSSMADKIQHQLSLDHRFSDRASVTLSQNYYWDHLTGSTQAKRTTNNEKYMAWNLSPLSGRKSFLFHPYLNYFTRDSDDAGNSAESTTITVGGDVNDRLDEHTTWGAGYEYRAFIDQNTKAGSEAFHRLKLNLGRDLTFFSRRLFFSIGPNLDIRNNKNNDDKDVNINTALNLQYDFSQKVVMRLGHTITDTNSAAPGSDYCNNRGFWEFDFLLNKNRSARFVVRGERNNYISENGDQSYKEQRVISKFVINF